MQAALSGKQPVEVDVGGVGFTQRGNAVAYGIVLHNPSDSQNASNITLAINVLGASGHSLATESQSVPTIASNTSFYAGAETFVPKGGSVSKLDVRVSNVEPAATSEKGVPRTENLRIEDLGSQLGIIVHGEVVNDLDVPIPAHTDVGIVFFDAAGAVIGGTKTSIKAEVPPGGRAAFDRSGFALPRPVNIAAIRASAYY